MAIHVINQPAEPHCGGLQWTIPDVDLLATLIALVLIGRAQHAARVMAGALILPVLVPAAMRLQIRNELLPGPDQQTYHRDGLLFEIICWLVAKQQSLTTEVISEPHTKATQQGVDTIKVRFDEVNRRLEKTTIYEYKCTTDARAQFRDRIVPAFRRYFEGSRDPQLIQATIALLARYELTDQEEAEIYGAFVEERPLAFQAVLTVEPGEFPVELCVDLFAGYTGVTPALADRLGDTLPLPDVRAWFEELAARTWDKIDV